MMNAASDIEAAQQQASEGKYYEGGITLHIEPFSRVSNLHRGQGSAEAYENAMCRDARLRKFAPIEDD
ncbi:hypothetical protein HFO55_27300 [Rhizobium leguminosarum]|uniref:hypothetical protein n=1 Tax=Rhizobium leguminosarum TaxID=384 RepID=UPI001C986C45|nr:hypothetical protein [Rhizobium leguminosarum]MBY5570892.1 hypothetical protein [Rhizobium leguminosarum]MBY5577353.1 hypothetical protein [Rhizobium leguminosarum]